MRVHWLAAVVLLAALHTGRQSRCCAAASHLQASEYDTQHWAQPHVPATLHAHGAVRRLQAVVADGGSADGESADGGSAPELVPDVLHGEQVAAAKQQLQRQDAVVDAADPGKHQALGHDAHDRGGDQQQGGAADQDADADFQPASFQQQQHGHLDTTQHVPDQVQPSQNLAEQRAQEQETMQNNLLLEALRAKDGGQHGQGSPDPASGTSAHDDAAAGGGTASGGLAAHSGFEASAAQQRRLASQAAEEDAGPQDGHASRQRHLQQRHDAKYAQHLSRTTHTPPAGQQVPGGGAGGQHATWQQQPRVLQRSEGFRRSADEVGADLIGHGDAGAAAYHPKPAARLLEELVQQDGVQRASVMEVAIMTTLMGSASGLGAVPFFFVGSLSAEWAALANALACGVMLAASFDLVHEGQPYGAGLTILGVILGALFIKASQEWLEKWEDVRFEGLQGINAQKTMLLVTVMAAHALGEGSGVGVSFCGHRGWAQGVLVTLAIGFHNIPEGLAVATVLVARGVSPRAALTWAMLCSLPQPLVAVPSFMFVNAFKAMLPLALGFAAGCMVWMVFAELMPDALEAAAHGKVATAATFSAAWLEGLRMGMAKLERPDGTLASPFAGDPAVVLPTLAVLLPAALPAAAAGGLVSVLLAPGPVLLGIAAGLLAWGGAASLTAALWGSQIGFAATAFWALSGGAAVIFTWRWLSRPKVPAAAKAKAEDSTGAADNSHGAMNGVAHVNGEAWIPAAGQLISTISPQAGVRHPWHAEDGTLASGGGLTPGDSGVLPTYMQGPPPPDSSGGKHASRRGRVPLPPWGPQALVAGLAVLALAADGVPTGWRAAVAADGGASEAARLWLPLALDSFMRGLAGAALAAPLLGRTLQRTVGLALTAGGVPAAAAALSIACGGSDPLADSVPALLDASALTAKVQAATAGALLVAALWLLLPAAYAMRSISANKGFALGCVVAASAHGITSLMCLATPYCLTTLAIEQ